MKERPILFSTEMVKAILEGRKTMTRRVCKNMVSTEDHGMGHNPMVLNKGFWYRPMEYSPYGKPGDRLWVRERINKHGDGNAPYTCTYDADLSPVTATCHVMWCGRSTWEWGDKRNVLPSIFMPRWASRITLEIVNVRVERVQDISHNDSIAEGIKECRGHNVDDCECAIVSFQKLWDSINAKRGYPWDSNPYVWVLEFNRVD